MHQSGHEAEEREVEAMRGLAAGRENELNGIMDRWSARVTALLFRMTGNPSTAADLAQETFVRLYMTRGRFRPGSSERPFSTWLFGIAANLGRTRFRWHRRHPESPLDEAPESGSTDNPARSAEQRERSEAVRNAISTLPPDLREALVLAEYEGLSHADIASVAGCSPKAIERRLARAREHLRLRLAGYLSD